jgi:hypothetical protein
MSTAAAAADTPATMEHTVKIRRHVDGGLLKLLWSDGSRSPDLFTDLLFVCKVAQKLDFKIKRLPGPGWGTNRGYFDSIYFLFSHIPH